MNQPTKPTVNRMVHYVSYGTPNGEYRSECRAAIVTQVNADQSIGLCVVNPTGLFFHESVMGDNLPVNGVYQGGTWHWAEIV